MTTAPTPPALKTVTVQIGNSDDKLTQREWGNFVQHTKSAIESWSVEVHFFGTSHGWAAWQNAAFVFSIGEKRMRPLQEELAWECKQYKQDSIAWTEGITVFIGPSSPS